MPPGDALNIIGIDFTSAPTRNKPITCAQGSLQREVLSIGAVRELGDYRQFETLLGSAAPWIAGIDFPFGQSRRLIAGLHWPDTWAGYVGLVSGLSRDEFVALLEDYKRERPPGDREHRRVADKAASSISPQKLYGVPVAKMFFEGAPRLLASPASIVPVRPNADRRVVVETYPALAVRRFIGRRSYKSDSRAKQTGKLRQARAEIVACLGNDACVDAYGVRVKFSAAEAGDWVSDATGDRLDAVLCALQAAWAWGRREEGYGMPRDVDAAEGWIADPGLVRFEG